MKIPILALAVVAMTSTPSHAIMFCSEPAEPYCTRYDTGAFDDEYEFESCKQEVEAHVRKVKAYISCLSEESDAVIRKSNKTIDAFNERASSIY